MIEIAKQVWEDLSNVTIDVLDKTESSFRHFPAGTDRFEIWQWIEEEYNVSIAKDLLNIKE